MSSTETLDNAKMTNGPITRIISNYDGMEEKWKMPTLWIIQK